MNKIVSKAITMLLLILISYSAVADVILDGQLDIGDNSYYSNAGYQYKVLSPSSLITNDNKPVNPMHFTLTQDSTISQIVLNGDSGILFGVNFVVWNSAGNIVIQKMALNSQVDRISGSWFLPAGDYRIAVWGQCLNSNNMISDDTSCFNGKSQYEWDDISFSSITLVGATSSATNYIQRQHIGDSYEVFNSQSVDRWYPDYPTGLSTIYALNYSQPSSINRLAIYHFRDWNTLNASRVQIRSKNSGTVLWEHIFTQIDNNIDLLLQPQITVAAGEYEVVIDTDKLSDADDLSWDDVVITSQINQLQFNCSDIYPYPVQGRISTDSLDFTMYNSDGSSYIASRIKGTKNGYLGYSSLAQILHMATKVSNDGNCDNQLCKSDKLAGSKPLITNPFDYTATKDIVVQSGNSKTLASSDGYLFDQVATNDKSMLFFSVPGIKINSLTIGSGKGSNAYSVKFSAGEYWIKNLTMNNDTYIVLDGNVTLHVDQLNMGSASFINSLGTNSGGDVSKLNLNIYTSLIMGNGSTLTGLIYQADTAGGNVQLGATSYIIGRVNAKKIQLGNNSTIDASSYSCSSSNAIDHYQIEYLSNNISCEPAQITIKACTDALCSSINTTASSSVTLTSKPVSSWNTNPATLTNGVASVYLSHYVAENVILGLSGSTPVCLKDGAVDAACQIPFVSSAFSFDFPTFYAGSNSGNVTLKALQASSSNPAVCTTLFANKTQNVSFASQYILPATGTSLPTLNGFSFNSSAAVTLPLAFDSTGAASLNLAYNDAGVLGITAQTTIKDTVAGTLSVSGSDNVAVLPAKILLTAAGQTACTGSSDTDYAGCAVYKTVGQPFTLSAKAGYLSGSTWNTTANFSTSHLAASALPLVQHKLVAPSAGTLPALATTNLSFSAGTASASLSESDVGVYQYGVTDFVPYSAYQNESPQKTVALSWSDPVGRFIPAKLQATAVTQGTLTTDTCSNNAVNAALGYTGQALRFATMPTLSVTALGSDGSTVMKNYQGFFAKITSAIPSGSGAFTANLLPKNNVNSLTSLATWSAGSWSTLTNAYNLLYSFGADNRFTFTKTNTNQVAPFETSMTISALADSDGVAASSLPLNLWPVAPDTSAFKVYSGRLTLDSVNGAENNSLALPFYMQYWNGSAYTINNVDNCTSLTGNALQMNNLTSWTGIPLRVASATNGVATTTASLSPAKVSSGAGAISFTAPNASGWVDIAASASLPDWMKDFTLPSGLSPARASFGYYHGNDRLIYRREVFGGQ